MESPFKTWILYNLVVCFAAYWLSNLILWYPWSISENWGQIIMLSINPLLWGYASYCCMLQFPGKNILTSASLNSLLFILEAITSDMILFAGIQKSADKLWQPTTYYGWGFVATVPFLIYLLFRKKILHHQGLPKKPAFGKPLGIGLVSFGIIAFILVKGIRFS